MICLSDNVQQKVYINHLKSTWYGQLVMCMQILNRLIVCLILLLTVQNSTVCRNCVRVPDVSLFVAARNMKNWRKTSARCRSIVPSPVLCTVFTRTTNCTSSRSPCHPPFPIPPSSWLAVRSGKTSPCTHQSDSAPGHILPWYWMRTSPVQSRRTVQDHRMRSRRKRD